MSSRGILLVIALLSLAGPVRADITTGLVGRWPFDGNTNDISGNNNHGSIVGPLTATTDRFGIANRAYSFNGLSSYVQVPASPSLNSPSTACTQAAWVLQSGISLVGTGFNPLTMKSITGENGFMYRMITNPTYVGAAFNNWNTAMSAGQNTPLNEWHHFATVFNGTTVRYFYDGVFIGSQPMVMTITTDNRPLTIGADTPGVLEVLNGKIDDVCIYNRALSDADILELKEQATPTAVAGSTPIFTVGQLVPNPSNGESRLELTLESAQSVAIDVFDVAGRRVRALESGRRNAGHDWITWDGRRDDGSAAASGVYFYRITAGSMVQTRRMVLLR